MTPEEKKKEENRKKYEAALVEQEQAHADLTAAVLELMQDGDSNWMQPWTAGEGGGLLPINVKTKRAYTGGNMMRLMTTQWKRGLDNGLWGTVRQWEKVGASVDEDGLHITLIRYGFSSRTKRDANGDPVIGKDGKAERVTSGYPIPYKVWHQTATTYKPRPAKKRDKVEIIAEAQEFFDLLPSVVTHGGNRACFVPKKDVIKMPEMDTFESAEDYYATLAHEHTHWTGHEDRIDRGLKETTTFGSADYAREELVAELGAVFLCNQLGISTKPRKDHAQYLNAWISKLMDDDSFIWKASQEASKAVRVLNQMVEEAREQKQDDLIAA